MRNVYEPLNMRMFYDIMKELNDDDISAFFRGVGTQLIFQTAQAGPPGAWYMMRYDLYDGEWAIDTSLHTLDRPVLDCARITVVDMGFPKGDPRNTDRDALKSYLVDLRTKLTSIQDRLIKEKWNQGVNDVLKKLD